MSHPHILLEEAPRSLPGFQCTQELLHDQQQLQPHHCHAGERHGSLHFHQHTTASRGVGAKAAVRRGPKHLDFTGIKCWGACSFASIQCQLSTQRRSRTQQLSAVRAPRRCPLARFAKTVCMPLQLWQVPVPVHWSCYKLASSLALALFMLLCCCCCSLCLRNYTLALFMLLCCCCCCCCSLCLRN